MAPRPHPSRPLPHVALAVVVTALVALFSLPAVAHARDYEITEVAIDATVDEGGTLHVVETRTFAFDGSFNGVYWEIPVGRNASNGRDVSVEVVSAGEGTPGDLRPFEESPSGLDGTYEVGAADSGVRRVTLYSAQEDDTVSFTLAYDATGIVTRWEDTGELYWKFVSDGWDVSSENVTCTLHLPVPGAESVRAGDNVRAWGHGPLDASVAFNGDDVVYTVPGVGTDEYAEMRVTFPATWVAGLEQTPGRALDGILSEEQRWADEANSRRAAARLAYFGTLGVALALAGATVVVAVTKLVRYRRACRPQFQDTYFRDVPTDDHPAVLGALHNGGDAQAKELTATLMHLTDAGYVRLDKVTTRRRGVLGEKTEEDYRLTKLRDVPGAGEVSGTAAKAARAIDEETLSFLFDKVADARDDEDPSLLFSELEEFAKRRPQRYSDAYDSWKGLVEGRCLKRFASGDPAVAGRGLVSGLGAACAVALVVATVALLVMEAPLPVTATALLALGLAAAVALLVAHSMRDLTREGIEVRAQLEALERWLREFTRLDEAVPSDVTLWNRLLVMAVVLGVADEVVSQLRVARPELLDDPYLMPTYGWLFWHGHGHGAASALSEHLDSAHHVSAAALASSSSSSGGGGGGGFSGGGGGGFGGGGGGGAF